MTAGNEEGWGRGVNVDDFLQVVLATRDTREESVDVHSVEDLKMVKSVVKEIDQITTVFLVTHYNRIVGEIQNFQLLGIRGEDEKYG